MHTILTDIFVCPNHVSQNSICSQMIVDLCFGPEVARIISRRPRLAVWGSRGRLGRQQEIEKLENWIGSREHMGKRDVTWSVICGRIKGRR